MRNEVLNAMAVLSGAISRLGFPSAMRASLRHYYDVAMMAEGQIKTEALADIDLLAQVVNHKETFYPAGWARYDLAHSGSLRVSPAESRIQALRRDYRDMADMIFGEPPNFNLVLEKLAVLEAELNS